VRRCIADDGRIVATGTYVNTVKTIGHPARTIALALLLLALLLILIGCKNDPLIDPFTHFNFETDYVVKVPASPVTSEPIEIVTPEIATHSDVLFTANKTRADLVEEIKLTQLDLSVKTPEGGTLTFLKSVDIYARAEGLPEVRVAYKENVPADVGSTLQLDATGVDLTEYFKKAKYQLRITVTSDEELTQDCGVNAHGKFFVDAKVLGE
jgi:hypothetical protein